MKSRLFFCFLVMLLSCISCVAQQAQPQVQPLTFWYDYTINPGKEDEFMDLVKTVGQPVRDKLLADGVVQAWGLQTPLLRVPGTATHTIWYVVNDYAALEKVDSAMRAQITRLNEEAAKSGALKKGQKPAASPTARLGEIADSSKVHDYLTRDLVSGQYNFPPAGTLPYTRFNFFKVNPGKGGFSQGLGEVQQACFPTSWWLTASSSAMGSPWRRSGPKASLGISSGTTPRTSLPWTKCVRRF